ncbi:MAG: L-sulfolactate dehydrogenase [archaeon]|nr:L-sulfolactate dehydrogenase [archaeon]
MKISVSNERMLVREILLNLGVSKEQAIVVSEATLDADIKGFTSHGLGRFPQYINGLENGFIKPSGDIEIVRETVSTALINGNSLFGQYVAHKAMELCIEKASQTGIGAVGTFNSNHFGVAGFYSDLAIYNDMIGVVMCNTASAVAPLGGKKAVLGTNPLAIGIPTKKYVSVDMATSTSARGKLLEAERKGVLIPEGIAIDVDGKPTTDPTEALKGSILPFGGVKGYALNFIIEILCGPLVDAAFGVDVTGTAGDYKENCNKGDLFIAIDPSKFVDITNFKDQVEELIEDMRASGEKIRIPGDGTVGKYLKNQKNGLPIDEKLYIVLNDICEKLDIDLKDYLED